MDEYLKSNEFLKEQFMMEKLVYQNINQKCYYEKNINDYDNCVENFNYYLRSFKFFIINLKKSEIKNKKELIKSYRSFLLETLSNN